MPVAEWFVFAIFAFLTWGLWGFFPKLASFYISPQSILLYEVLGTLIIGVIAYFFFGFRLEIHTKGATFGLLTGIAAALGSLFYFIAVSKGKASVVVTLTALYPLITILLAFLILREPITLKQGAGILLALVAMLLFSM